MPIPQLTACSYCEIEHKDKGEGLGVKNKVNREENDDESHLILLIRQTASDGNPSDLRRQLVFAKELGVPVSRVNLINGDTLQNVIVKEVMGDLVIFQNHQTRSNVALSSIVSWGSF